MIQNNKLFGLSYNILIFVTIFEYSTNILQKWGTFQTTKSPKRTQARLSWYSGNSSSRTTTQSYSGPTVKKAFTYLSRTDINDAAVEEVIRGSVQRVLSGLH